MAKTEEELKNQLLSNLNKDFNIIVTGPIPTEEAKQVGLEAIEGLDNIFSASLKGKEVLKIEKLENVESIELDTTKKILSADA